MDRWQRAAALVVALVLGGTPAAAFVCDAICARAPAAADFLPADAHATHTPDHARHHATDAAEEPAPEGVTIDAPAAPGCVESLAPQQAAFRSVRTEAGVQTALPIAAATGPALHECLRRLASRGSPPGSPHAGTRLVLRI